MGLPLSEEWIGAMMMALKKSGITGHSVKTKLLQNIKNEKLNLEGCEGS